MKTIYYVPPVLALAIGAAWFTSQKPSDTEVKQAEVKPKLSSTKKSYSLPAAEEKQPKISQQSTQLQRKSQTSEELANLLYDRAKVESLGREKVIAMVVDWLKIDPTAAIAWLYKLQELDYKLEEQGHFRNAGYFITEVAIKAMEHDEAATLAWIVALPKESERLEFDCISKFTQMLFSKINSQEEFDAEVATMPPLLKDAAHIEWMQRGHVSQQAAQQLISIYQRTPNLMYSTPSKGAWRELLASYQEQGNYSDGIAWAMALRSETSKASHVSDVTKEWVKKDAKATAEATNNLPQGPIRDAAAENLADALKNIQPSNAFAWAQSISDAKERLESTSYVIKTWLKHDPLEATKAMNTLPPEERRQIFR